MKFLLQDRLKIFKILGISGPERLFIRTTAANREEIRGNRREAGNESESGVEGIGREVGKESERRVEENKKKTGRDLVGAPKNK